MMKEFKCREISREFSCHLEIHEVNCVIIAEGNGDHVSAC